MIHNSFLQIQVQKCTYLQNSLRKLFLEHPSSKSQVIVPVCMTIVSCVGLSPSNDSLRGLGYMSVCSSVKRLPPLD
jgi:hypothetical protein